MIELTHLLYVSTAAYLMEGGELVAMLTAARTRNAAERVTGLLLYRDGNFLQFLEGPADAVNRLGARIMADVRHYDIVTLQNGPAEHRVFDDFSMGFEDVSALSPGNAAGYTDFLRTGFRDRPLLRDAPFLQNFLETFAGFNRHLW